MTDYSDAKSVKSEKPKGARLTTFPMPDDGGCEIKLEFPEFQTLCPVSGRPDAGSLVITYRPRRLVIESKSLRDYLLAWREVKTWQEHATCAIASELYKTCKPDWLMVEVQWTARGGIYATTSSVLPDDVNEPDSMVG